MKQLVAYLACIILCCPAKGNAQAASPSLKVTGEVTTPLDLSISDIAKMPHVTASVKERDGTTRTYSGVPVTAILNMAGVTMGKQLRGENLSKYLLVTSADGYQVVFSLAELDSTFTDRVAILADSVEGKPLPQGVGPLKMVVQGDKKPARSSFEVMSFVIKYAKD